MSSCLWSENGGETHTHKESSNFVGGFLGISGAGFVAVKGLERTGDSKTVHFGTACVAIT